MSTLIENLSKIYVKRSRYEIGVRVSCEHPVKQWSFSRDTRNSKK